MLETSAVAAMPADISHISQGSTSSRKAAEDGKHQNGRSATPIVGSEGRIVQQNAPLEIQGIVQKLPVQIWNKYAMWNHRVLHASL
jgi:hypothetical protein